MFSFLENVNSLRNKWVFFVFLFLENVNSFLMLGRQDAGGGTTTSDSGHAEEEALEGGLHPPPPDLLLRPRRHNQFEEERRGGDNQQLKKKKAFCALSEKSLRFFRRFAKYPMCISKRHLTRRRLAIFFLTPQKQILRFYSRIKKLLFRLAAKL